VEELLRPHRVEAAPPPGGFRSRPAGVPSAVAMPSKAVASILGGRPGSRALVDVAIAGGALAASRALVAHGGIAPAHEVSGDLSVPGAVLLACSAVPLVAWRLFPLGVFAVTAAAGVLLAGLGYGVDLLLGPAVAIYLLAASRDGEAPWTWRISAAVIAMFVVFVAVTATVQGRFPVLESLHTGLAWAVAWFAGERTRLRREQVAELGERALRAEREAERERLLAVAEERARIARDLHDSAGHAINVIAVRAGAARLRYRDDPERSLSALEAIEEVARQTVEEIDHIVGTLREQGSTDGGVEAPPGLASLDSLIAHHSAAGLEVTLAADGQPRPLGGAADRAAYRILQEALTNAGRHGAGSARIELTFANAALDLTVTNPVVSDTDASRPGGGHGLIGMRERATLLGGELETERSNGVFRLRARIPYGGHAG
jgi:signal transduction histidine kinase